MNLKELVKTFDLEIEIIYQIQLLNKLIFLNFINK